MAALLTTAFLVVAGFGAFALLTAADDLRDAEDLIDSASLALEDGRLADAQSALAEAESLVLGANETIQRSPILDVVRSIPVARDNLVALTDSIELSATVIHGGVRILDSSTSLQGPEGTLEVSLAEGTVPLEAVTQAQKEIAALSSELVLVRQEDPSPFLLPMIEEARADVYGEAESRRRQLGVLDQGLELVRTIAGGDGARRYLIAVANTAEMRGSGGMILNYGVLEGRDGTIDLTAFGRVDELALSVPVDDEVVPADYLERWEGFEPLRRWRQANLGADFQVIAPALLEMYTAATRLPVNGVIQVDPAGLAAILEGVGPVRVPEVGEVTAETVVDLTLNDAYFRFPDVDQRTDVLGDVAEAAFTRLVEGEFPSLRPLATAVSEAVEARHIVVHSTSASTQIATDAFGAGGALPPLEEQDSLHLTVQNLSGNKLDYYLDTALRFTGESPTGAIGRATAEITLSNDAPTTTTTPAYIFGPGPGATPQPAGVLRSVVTLYLPLGTSLEDVGGDPLVEGAVSGTEAGRPFVSFIVDTPAGAERSVTLELGLAPRSDDRAPIVLVPSPRVRPTTVEIDVSGTGYRLVGDVTLDRVWLIRPDSSPERFVAPVFR